MKKGRKNRGGHNAGNSLLKRKKRLTKKKITHSEKLYDKYKNLRTEII